ncbi:hypothetical protein SAMN04488595_11616 [Ralstonia sp. 25mfcol4.1]|nr:hypothetical protein [Ralstonia sp. 25mfcol4.1]SDP67792.1 hypothetical protein SAMN04488595_11616 [Ralstonia sp. 25mfcol4.1]
MKEAVGFTVMCWLSGAVLLWMDSAAATALSGVLALAALDIFTP